MAIFVSYSRLDEPTVVALARHLESAGREVWFHQHCCGGTEWWDKTLEKIRSAELVIFVLSDNTMCSKACLAELDYALALHRTVLAVQVGDVMELHSGPLSGLRTVEFNEQDATSASTVVAAVHLALEQRRPLPEVLPPVPQIPFSYGVPLSTRQP